MTKATRIFAQESKCPICGDPADEGFMCDPCIDRGIEHFANGGKVFELESPAKEKAQ